MESRNAKFIENDTISGSDRSLGFGSERDFPISQPSTSSHTQTIVIHHALSAQMRVEEAVPGPPQAAEDNLVVPIQQIPEAVEEPVDQYAPQENVDTTLRRSTRVRRTAISDDYMVYLQESEYHVGVEDDPEIFSQATTNPICG